MDPDPQPDPQPDDIMATDEGEMEINPERHESLSLEQYARRLEEQTRTVRGRARNPQTNKRKRHSTPAPNINASFTSIMGEGTDRCPGGKAPALPQPLQDKWESDLIRRMISHDIIESPPSWPRWLHPSPCQVVLMTNLKNIWARLPVPLRISWHLEGHRKAYANTTFNLGNLPMSVPDADGEVLPVLKALAVATFGMDAMKMKWAEKDKNSEEYAFLAGLSADEETIAAWKTAAQQETEFNARMKAAAEGQTLPATQPDRTFGNLIVDEINYGRPTQCTKDTLRTISRHMSSGVEGYVSTVDQATNNTLTKMQTMLSQLSLVGLRKATQKYDMILDDARDLMLQVHPNNTKGIEDMVRSSKDEVAKALVATTKELSELATLAQKLVEGQQKMEKQMTPENLHAALTQKIALMPAMVAAAQHDSNFPLQAEIMKALDIASQVPGTLAPRPIRASLWTQNSDDLRRFIAQIANSSLKAIPDRTLLGMDMFIEMAQAAYLVMEHRLVETSRNNAVLLHALHDDVATTHHEELKGISMHNRAVTCNLIEMLRLTLINTSPTTGRAKEWKSIATKLFYSPNLLMGPMANMATEEAASTVEDNMRPPQPPRQKLDRATEDTQAKADKEGRTTILTELAKE
ncbi:hypothetical protein BBAD15_g5830 [Beauveria bassiana D1-5]|uniref:Uncharacterized protein n=1 Tax=Beauveria bassiana D1-5 TaxID=1245745 RepID=A0A0A2VMJ9_BEABA|nr:hypothetical protein BBAD15_g5830 [Beauveria bassiana D1-5]